MMKSVRNCLHGRATFILLVALFVSNMSLLIGAPKPLYFQEKIDVAQQALEDVYYDLVEKGHFDNFNDNRLIFHGGMLSNFPENGEILLKLVEQLQKRSRDIDSQHLLDLINTVLCLRLHRFICKLDAPKALQGSVINSFFTLHDHKATSSSHPGQYSPFQTSLTKMMLAILTIIYSNLAYDAQKESLIYRFEEIRRELMATNKALQGQAIDEYHITDFIKAMESYGLAEPLVKPRNVKRIILISVVIIIVIVLIVLLIYKIAPNLPKSWDDIKKKFQEIGTAFGDFFGASVVSAAERRFYDPAVQQGIRQFMVNNGGALIQGITTGPDGQPNPALVTGGQALIQGIINAPAHDGPPRDTALVQGGHMFVRGALSTDNQAQVGVLVTNNIVPPIQRAGTGLIDQVVPQLQHAVQNAGRDLLTLPHRALSAVYNYIAGVAQGQVPTPDGD